MQTAAKYDFTPRISKIAFAIESVNRAQAAVRQTARFADEIAPVTISWSQGDIRFTATKHRARSVAKPRRFHSCVRPLQ